MHHVRVVKSPTATLVLTSYFQSPTAIFIFVALGIVQTGNPQPTMDPGGRSLGGGAISGASFRFARPAFMTTFNRTNTMNSTTGVGVSFPVATYGARRHSVSDFKMMSGDSTVVGTPPDGRGHLNDVSEGSSYDSRVKENDRQSMSVVDVDIDVDIERQAGDDVASIRTYGGRP